MPWDLKTLASIGGKARAKKLTKAQRSAISRKGGLAARGKPRKKYRKQRKAAVTEKAVKDSPNSRFLCDALVEKKYKQGGGK